MSIAWILQLLPVLLSLVTEGEALIVKITNDLKQAKELTPEEEAARDAWIKQVESQTWWTPQE